jgi:hypothetical protein
MKSSSPFFIYFEHLPDHLFSLRRGSSARKTFSFYFGQKFSLALGTPRNSSMEKFIENDTQRPDVALG